MERDNENERKIELKEREREIKREREKKGTSQCGIPLHSGRRAFYRLTKRPFVTHLNGRVMKD